MALNLTHGSAQIRIARLRDRQRAGLAAYNARHDRAGGHYELKQVRGREHLRRVFVHETNPLNDLSSLTQEQRQHIAAVEAAKRRAAFADSQLTPAQRRLAALQELLRRRN